MAQKGATGDFFFQFCTKIKKILKMDNIFMEEKKKEWIFFFFCGRPTGFNFSRTGNIIFFMDSLAFIRVTRWTGNKPKGGLKVGGGGGGYSAPSVSMCHHGKRQL